MRTLRAAGYLSALLLLMALGPFGWAGPDDEEQPDPSDIPVVGRPDAPFSGASGRFTISGHAEPTAVEAQKPLTFTLRIQAVGRVYRPPQRIELRQVKTFADRFYIEDPADGNRHPDAKTWEFSWRLVPRRSDVTEVPGLAVAFYNPDLRAEGEKAFQVPYTDPIALTVTPHEVFPVALQAPEGAFHLATGPGLLARREPWEGPGPVTAAVLLLVPPLLGAGWYIWWRRRYPDAARLAGQRRSRAARLALQRLRGAGRLPPSERAGLAVDAVAGYLRQRLDLRPAEPTPGEVAALLAQHGCTAALAEQATGFLKAADAARFLPESGGDLDLADAATQLILAVETETCTPAHS